jgi:hypothetical protein
MSYFRSQKLTDVFGTAHFFPSEKELSEHGISFQKIEQKPGDAIFNGYKAIHWVYNPVSSLIIINDYRMEGLTLLGISYGSLPPSES